MNHVITGNSGAELIVFPGRQGLEAAFVPEFEVNRHRRELGAVAVSCSVLCDFRCPEHEDDESVAIDLDRLLADASRAADLSEWAIGMNL